MLNSEIKSLCKADSSGQILVFFILREMPFREETMLMLLDFKKTPWRAGTVRRRDATAGRRVNLLFIEKRDLSYLSLIVTYSRLRVILNRSPTLLVTSS